MLQRPVAVSLLLCETVIVDDRTRYVTPVNCFRRRDVERFPSEPIPFYVVSWLTDGLGDGTLVVVIQRLDTEEPIADAAVRCRFSDPLSEIRCTVRVRCSFPVEGFYQVILLADGEALASRRFQVSLAGEAS